MTLSDLEPGQSGNIKVLWATGSLRYRLMDMGILPGKSVSICRIAPLGDPIEVRVSHCRLSLRKAEAGKIEVEMQS